MSLQKLKLCLREGIFPRLMLFCGEEEYLKLYYKNAVIKKLVPPETADFNLDIFEGNSLDLTRLSQSIDSVPVMSENRVIIIKDLALGKSNVCAAYLAENAADFPEYCSVIIYQETSDTSLKDSDAKRLLKDTSNTLGVEFTTPSTTELTDWAVRYAAAQKKTLSRSNAEYLIMRCSHSLNLIKNEVDKLISARICAEISKSDIDLLVEPSSEYKIYELTEAIITRNRSRTMLLVDELYKAKYQAVEIAPMIYKAFMDLYTVKAGTAAGKSVSDISRSFGIRDFLIRKYIPLASKASIKYLSECLDACCSCDTELKSSRMDGRLILEKTIGLIWSSEYFNA